MSKILELAKKLKALADRGIDGEKENATEMLEKFCKKHNISLTDIEEEKSTRHYFKTTKEQSSFFGQIVRYCLGKKAAVYCVYKKKYESGVDCTPSEYLEIRFTFNFYWKAYKAEQKLFYAAFIQKNNLYPTDAETIYISDEKEIERLCKIECMANGIDKYTIRKAIK